jgi:hypothetical protein
MIERYPWYSFGFFCLGNGDSWLYSGRNRICHFLEAHLADSLSAARRRRDRFATQPTGEVFAGRSRDAV